MAGLISTLKAAKTKVSKKKVLKNSKLSPEEELNKKIAIKAYELYEKRGCCPGHEMEDWLEAEQIVKANQVIAFGD